ncbi:sodium:calcium antiporter [Pseudomonas sp. Marseille-QA0892]
MSPSIYVLIAVGLTLLSLGAYGLFQGTRRVLAGTRLPVALTGILLALAIAAPELSVAIRAALEGKGDLAIGNAIGTPLINLSLVLGAVAFLLPIHTTFKDVWWHPVALGIAGVGFAWLALDGQLTHGEGALMTVGWSAYTLVVLRHRERNGLVSERAVTSQATSRPARRLPLLWNLFMVAAGAVFIVLGADALVRGATELGVALGLSELVVGLTVIAAGTALPEFVLCLVAAYRGQHAAVVSILFGSALTSLLLATGLATFVNSIGLSISPNALALDLPLMLTVLAVAPFLILTGTVGRLTGLALVAAYGAYLLYLALFSTGMPQLTAYRHMLLTYAMPAAGMLLLARLAWHYVRSRRG